MRITEIAQVLSCVWLFATPWTVSHQAPLSMGFPRWEHWSILPFLSLGNHPDPRIEPRSPIFQADSLPLSHQGSPALWITERSEKLKYDLAGYTSQWFHKDRDFSLFLFTDALPVTRSEPATMQLNHYWMFKRMTSVCFHTDCLKMGGYYFQFIDKKTEAQQVK